MKLYIHICLIYIKRFCSQLPAAAAGMREEHKMLKFQIPTSEPPAAGLLLNNSYIKSFHQRTKSKKL